MRVFTVDSFTDRPFRGNPAGVCLLDAPADEEWMLAVAAEMRHSETAFVHGDGDGPRSLRWFTPAVEVALCGHATLATAHVLYSLGASGRLEFATKSGILATERTDDGLIIMDFPAAPPQEAEPPAGLAEALGVAPVWCGRSRFDVLVEVDSADAVRAVAPDLRRLAEVDTRGVIVTARGDGGADYVSRFFAPRVGVDEDPVTGSAHCALAPYWSAKLGRDALLGRQVSARGGEVRTTVRGDRVELAGRAVTVWSGELHA
ncbi:PhzF family phenazine biosynthesis protein [Thermostaphylospora chromogena]|uniref:Phenazine biosynthesis protein PhzF family n=1 Tax=Thermostaphylospora chromogena TaxID=35622 RepID=A0A1H1EWE1_9ACTN|nr:PhzF family phenazine biosynthesis protein [Thermostaphylospora chromogena]SDQ92983.1 phenazine biosynthesis protein PhzF family [Thermostaphylospora chromogena]